MVVENEMKKALLDGGCAALNSGFFRLLDATAAVLASLGFASPAFAAASAASPSVALSTTISAASAPTAGVITQFRFETSTSSVRLRGTVSTSSGDIVVGSVTIPPGTTSVSCPGGVQLSLQVT